MKYPVLAFTAFFFGSAFVGNSQVNLVPNGSFEEYTDCPNGMSAIGYDQLIKCLYWYKPIITTSDYHNSCSSSNPTFSWSAGVPLNGLGWQEAYEGNGYLGLVNYSNILPNAAEYAQVKLLEPLKSCKQYLVSYNVSLADNSNYATSTLGLRLDSWPITSNNFSIDFPPHIFYQGYITDKVDWVSVGAIFEASGGEEYLTIGRFYDTLSYTNSNTPHIIVSCDTCLEYAYYYVDSVSVIEVSENIMNSEIPNVFTPDENDINDFWYPKQVCFDQWHCEILNRWGQSVNTFDFGESGWDGKEINGKSAEEGVYFYRISNGIIQVTGFLNLIR